MNKWNPHKVLLLVSYNLTVIIDLADRKVVGWSLSQTLNTSQTVIAAWKMAITNRPIITNLIFHSDRGVQYACYEFRDILKAQPLVMQSMNCVKKQGSKGKKSFRHPNKVWF